MLTPEIQNLIMIGVVGIAGLVIGLILGNMAGRRGSKTLKNKKMLAEIKKEGYAGIATLWYSPATKHVIAEMGDEYFREFMNLPVEQQKKALRLADLFTDWVHPVIPVEEKPAETPEELKIEPPVETPAEVAVPADETIPQISSSRPGATKPLPFVENESAQVEIPPAPPVFFTHEEPEPEPEPEPEESPKTESSVEPFNPLTTEETHTAPDFIKAKTVAGQISDIIAEIIQTSPLKEKGIKLIERPDHGVDVWFGMEKFDGIGAIPYPEVRQLIREAAARWERENSNK
jgi:hypothetical protein